MKQPTIKTPKEKCGKITSFDGVSLGEKLDSPTLKKAMNLSSRFYPYLSTRLSREEIGSLPGTGEINGILREQSGMGGTEALTFIRGNQFYYKGKLIEKDAVLGKDITAGKKQMVDFDGKIFIFPDALYYDYLAAENGNSEGLKKMENEVSLNFAIAGSDPDNGQMIFIVNKNLLNEATADSFCKKFMEMQQGDCLITDNVGDVQNFQTMKTVEDREYKYALYNDWTKVEILNIDETSRAVSMRVEIMRKDKTTVSFTIPSDSGIVKFKRHIPAVEYGFGANNRLWCARGTKLFVSAEGSPLNFNRFEEREGDSYYKNLKDRGGNFVAFATLNGKVVVLKESTMYQIYGSDATEFYVPYTIDKGCIDRESVVNLDNKLYFLSEDGVYTFDGNKIKNLGLNQRFKSGFAQTDGSRYFLMAETEKGDKELWTYDSVSGQWYMEESDDFQYFIRMGADLCAVLKDGKILRFGSGDERFGWEMETNPITAQTNSLKRAGELFLRLKGMRNTSAQVWVKTNREPDYRLVANILFDGRGERNGHIFRLGEEVEGITIPLGTLPCDNFALKIRGKGEMILYEAEYRSYLS